MASSIYVYQNMEEFERFYKGYLDEPMRKIKIIDMYVKDKSKLWVVTNTNDAKERPLLQKSLVHFRNGNIDNYKDDKTVLVLFRKLRFNFKKMKLDIFPRFLRKPLLQWRVDRYLGDPIKKAVIDYDHRYYDFEIDRINFILETNEN